MSNINDDLVVPPDSARTSPDFSLEHEDGLRLGDMAPKRFKSSFIFFSMEKQKQIKSELRAKDIPPKSANITKLVSQAWRVLPDESKKKYKDMARMDKVRYDEEHANYLCGRRSCPRKRARDPDAPKRPMSAFFAFANGRRAKVKAENPECSNGEISRLLSLKWKEAPEEVKQEYRDAESALWVVYKEGMAEFRKKHDGRKRTKKDPDNEEESDSRKKQQKGPKEEEFDNTSLGSDSFDDPTFTALGSAEPTNFHSQDDIMAASAALRGVKSMGTGNIFQVGGTGTQTGGYGGGGGIPTGIDWSAIPQGGGNNPSALLSGGLTANFFGVIQNPSSSLASNNNGSGIGIAGLGQEAGRQQYGSYAGIFGTSGTSQPNPSMYTALRAGPPGLFSGDGGGDHQNQLTASIGSSFAALGQPNLLANIGGLGGGASLNFDERTGGLGGSIGSSSGNRDFKRSGSMDGGVINPLMNETSSIRRLWNE